MELNPFEQRIVDHVLHLPKPGKHAARSALRHLERAWKLRSEMPELAVFSAITAEEEAATSVFHVLTRRRYEGAKYLRRREHMHKTALHPFILAIGKCVDNFKNEYAPACEFKSDLSTKGVERLCLRLSVRDGAGPRSFVYPLPPLEFTLSVNDIVHNFEPELSQLANEKNAESVLVYVRSLMNRRNLVLYASENGIPHVHGCVESFLAYRRSVVFCHLVIALLIDPYPQQQSFVQQGLNAFLRMLDLLPKVTEA